MARAIESAKSLHSSAQGPRPTPDDFQTIYRENYPAIWRFVLHLGIRKSDVPDVTHNVFLIAYRKLPEFEHRSSMRTWLCGIALRVARDVKKSAAFRLEVSENELSASETASAQGSVEALDHDGQLALARRLPEALPAEQREVFVLHELEQMTGPEIATLMSTSIGTVRSRLRRAREAFQKRLAELRQRGCLDV
jgi:RNA polymerase sigma-70 factor (ECF subfamily)